MVLSSSPLDQPCNSSDEDLVPLDTNTALGSTSSNPVMASDRQYAPLHQAVCKGDMDTTEKFLKDHPEALKAIISSLGGTALHTAALFGHSHIVKKLVSLMSKEDLELKAKDDGTALLAIAVHRDENKIEAAKCMVETNTKLPSLPDKLGWLPVTRAVSMGNYEMARFLYSVTPLEVLLTENGELGAFLLNESFFSKMFDIALDLVKRCPRLAITRRKEGWRSLLGSLADTPSAYLIESQLQLPFWKRWIYTWVHVRQEPAFGINELVINISKTTRRNDEYVKGTSCGRWHCSVWNILHLLGIEDIYEAKLAHKKYFELQRAACNVIPTLSSEEIVPNVVPAVVNAAKAGNAEFIVEVIKADINLLWFGSYGRDIFQLAVEFRQEKVYNLIHGLAVKDEFVSSVDAQHNTMLHLAGLLAPPTQLNKISGALLQMQRELQWFKEVESITPAMVITWPNKDNKTAKELFTENHKDLVKAGEEWTKESASSSSFVAALVATITFAAAFTVPGGNDQNTGYPIFLQKKLFSLFIISDAVSLFSSSTSLLMFLGLLTSRYAEDDFLKSLPTKLIIGLSTMFISIATMMIAFCAALSLMLRNQPLIVIPVTLLACFPVTLYIWLQFPLLVEIYKSTYGRGIFDRNVKPWP